MVDQSWLPGAGPPARADMGTGLRRFGEIGVCHFSKLLSASLVRRSRTLFGFQKSVPFFVVDPPL
jgi:hypothetical protein